MMKRSAALAVVGVVALIAGLLMVDPAQAAPGRQAIPNTRPGWLGRALMLGPASPGAPVSGRVYLAPRGGLSALVQEAMALSTRGNPQFRHFLTPSQYSAQFEPLAAMVSQVRDWLASSGFRVTDVEAHNRYVTISGSVASAQRAFGVRINRYMHDGITVQAPSSELSAPSALVGSVLAISGIDTTPNYVQPATVNPAPPSAGFRNATPCSAYYGQKAASDQPAFQGQTLPYAICGYVGQQFRSSYEGSTNLDGTGITVAITDAYASPTIVSDAATYASRNGDRAYAAGQLTQNLPSVFTRVNNGPRQCGASSWYGEETLDVEAVHAMAQGARIRYYGSASCYDQDFLDTLMRVDDEAAAQIVTNSWGQAEQTEKSSVISEYEALFLQGAAEGMSYMFSSGDNGDEVLNTGTLQTDYPPSDPFVTAVGGTTAAIDSRGALAWQTGWGTVKWSRSADGTTWNKVGFLYGSGGGESTNFPQPSYQGGITPTGARGVPDVAMDADVTTGMLIGQTQTFPDGVYYDQYRVGGTSLASPLFAGMTALAFQHAGGGVGLLNPTIYANSATGVFTDVTGPGPDAGNVRVDFADTVDSAAGLLYSVRTFDQDTSLTVTPGWDNVTGLGTPNSGWLTATG
jgi:subtilase family serine protease